MTTENTNTYRHGHNPLKEGKILPWSEGLNLLTDMKNIRKDVNSPLIRNCNEHHVHIV
jgi:ketol-acid reductoisomerase